MAVLKGHWLGGHDHHQQVVFRQHQLANPGVLTPGVLTGPPDVELGGPTGVTL